MSPKLSIIIPTRNRCNDLAVVLESINAQTGSADFEVLVIDNGSTDQTLAICKSFEGLIPGMRYIYEPEPGLLSGRHAGLNQSKGKYLAFIDDDVVLNPDYSSSLIGLFEGNPKIKLATGPSLPIYETEQPVWLSYFWENVAHAGVVTSMHQCCTWLSLLNLGNASMQIHPGFVFGLNFCIRREVLIELGGFHPDNIPAELQCFQGDGETGLTMKAEKAGYIAVYEPSLLLHHRIGASRLTAEYFKKRAFYQGVCDSFTAIRLENSGRTPPPASKYGEVLKRRLSRLYHSIRALRKGTPQLPQQVQQLKTETARSYKEGYKFHSNSFKTNRLVHDWVLRENYFDYRLPTK